MSPTIKDIAKKAGVSIATVSIVLNGKAKVSATTKEKVEAVIKEMDYHPLHSARRLATQTTGNIGYIIWDGYFSEAEMFYSQVFWGVEYAARNNDYYVLVTTVKEKFNPKEDLPRFLRSRVVDGIVIMGKMPTSLLDYLEYLKIPFVLVDFEVQRKAYNSIQFDNYNGTYGAIEYLLQRGRKNIAYVGGLINHPSIRKRYNGYRDALEAHNIPAEIIQKFSYCVDVENTSEIGTEGAVQLLKKHPEIDAIFGCTDHIALGVIEGIQKLGRSVPKDVAVIGFDDIPISSYNKPKLTTLRVPKMSVGKEAFNLLLDVMKKPDMKSHTRILPVELIIRGSSQCN